MDKIKRSIASFKQKLLEKEAGLYNMGAQKYTTESTLKTVLEEAEFKKIIIETHHNSDGDTFIKKSFHNGSKKVSIEHKQHKMVGARKMQELLTDPKLIKNHFGSGWVDFANMANKININEFDFIKEGEVHYFTSKFKAAAISFFLNRDGNMIGSGLGHYVRISRIAGELLCEIFTTTETAGCILISDTVDISGSLNKQFVRPEIWLNLQYFLKKAKPLTKPEEKEFFESNKEILEKVFTNEEREVKDFFDCIAKDAKEVADRKEFYLKNKSLPDQFKKFDTKIANPENSFKDKIKAEVLSEIDKFFKS